MICWRGLVFSFVELSQFQQTSRREIFSTLRHRTRKCRTFLFSNVAWRFLHSTSPSLIITVVFIVHNSAIFAFHSINSSMMTNNFHEWIFFSFLIWFLKGVYSETLNWVFKWKKIQWKISLKNGKLSAIIWELNLFWMLIKSRTRMMNVLTSCM